MAKGSFVIFLRLYMFSNPLIQGHLRKAAALEALGRKEEAKACYEKQAELENKATSK